MKEQMQKVTNIDPSNVRHLLPSFFPPLLLLSSTHILSLSFSLSLSHSLSQLVVIDVYHSRFHRVYYDKDPISHIMERDDIYIYELRKPLGDQDWVPVPVYMREIK